jgi:hypothetical protein
MLDKDINQETISRQTCHDPRAQMKAGRAYQDFRSIYL